MAKREKQMKKKISVVIPTYNEEGNVKPLARAIVNVEIIKKLRQSSMREILDRSVPLFMG